MSESNATEGNHWEAICRRCGGCCGAFDDPCQHLKKDSNNLYICEIYLNRLGTRKTIRGENFNCVSIKKILNTSWKNDWLCAYKNHPAISSNYYNDKKT
ncbi:MAG: hypothetical protein WCY05_02735 [Candidatus Omnitrophota bacterium]